MATSNRTAGKVRSHRRSGSSKLPNTSSATNRKAQIRHGGTTARFDEKHFQEGSAELQIPPLRFGMTKRGEWRLMERGCRTETFSTASVILRKRPGDVQSL